MIKKYWRMIKAFFKIKREVKKMKEIKAGYKTTEFWLSILSSVAAIYFAVENLIPPEIAAKITALITMIYTIARAIVKFTPSKKDDKILDRGVEIVEAKKK